MYSILLETRLKDNQVYVLNIFYWSILTVATQEVDEDFDVKGGVRVDDGASFDSEQLNPLIDYDHIAYQIKNKIALEDMRFTLEEGDGIFEC